MNTITTITTKGQVTIPNLIRRAFGIQPGDKAAFSAFEENKKQIVLTIIPQDVVHALSGSLASAINEPNHTKARAKARIARGNKYKQA